MNLRLNYHTQLFLKHVQDKKMEALALKLMEEQHLIHTTLMKS